LVSRTEISGDHLTCAFFIPNADVAGALRLQHQRTRTTGMIPISEKSSPQQKLLRFDLGRCFHSAPNQIAAATLTPTKIRRSSVMKLAYWMYAGPAHIGTLRVASSFKNVHAIMHAPLGDDYFNVMRSMLSRERNYTPVTTSVVDRNVLARGSQEKVVDNITRKDQEEHPDLIVLTPTCTSSILQEDLHNFVERAQMDSEGDVMLADVNHYRYNELQAADRTLHQIVKFYIDKARKRGELPTGKTEKPSVNIIGISTLGFHHNHDCTELKRLMADLGIEVNAILPEGASVHELKNLPRAWFNLVPYRELGLATANYLQAEFDMPMVDITPMGVVETARCIRAIRDLLKAQGVEVDYEPYIDEQTRFVSQAAWFSRSIDCQNLTGKKAVVFGDNTHAAAIAKVLSREMGIRVVLAGTYCKYDQDWFREQVSEYCDEVLVSDDNAEIANAIARHEPAAIFGTQMERHVGKRLDIPCGVIAAPIHVQNFPVGYRPFLGYEGANQLVDLVYNSFTLGMEDHLLEIFGGHDTKDVITKEMSTASDLTWSKDGLAELNKIPGFVRGKVKRNTEKFARERQIDVITTEVLYAAKEAVGA
jgi:light-independent protochlorophyllide reductase subunit B